MVRLIAIGVVIYGLFSYCSKPQSHVESEYENLPHEFANWSCEELRHFQKWRQYKKNGCG
jgi:hypothetical protein